MPYKMEKILSACPKCGIERMVRPQNKGRHCKSCGGKEAWAKVRAARERGEYVADRRCGGKYDMNAFAPTKRARTDESSLKGVRYEDVKLKPSSSRPVDGAALVRSASVYSNCGNSIAMCMESE